MTSKHIIVVGAGAAGLIAAKRAAELGARVTLVEKNRRVGMKILISGGGKCNLTHAGSMEEIRAQFRLNEARFLKPAFYRYSNSDFLAILHASALQTYARPDGRIFPVDPCTARDVVAALERAVRQAGVTVAMGEAASGLAVENGRVSGIKAEGRLRSADAVIVAVGGSSYPTTGTTGDGWKWAADIGHTIVPLRAALAPLYLADAQAEWSGIALRDVVLRSRLRAGGKEYARWRGDLLFTHKGVSGPCALGISREVAERLADGVEGGGIVEIDLSPDTTFEELQAQLRADFRESPRKIVSGIVDRLLPERLRAPFLAVTGIDPATRGAHLSAKALNVLVNTIKGWSLGGVRAVSMERGEVVAGGVSLDEVDPQTMASRKIRGLYLAGEILDLAGPVGGYNLQAAWSTGYVAGDAAAKD